MSLISYFACVLQASIPSYLPLALNSLQGNTWRGNITRMQSSFRSIQSVYVVCNFFSARANFISTSVNNFLGLFKSFLPSKVWNKLCSSLFLILRVGCRMHMSPQQALKVIENLPSVFPDLYVLGTNLWYTFVVS